MNKQEEYPGWANYETWNVALWITSDHGLYETAKTCKNLPDAYGAFLAIITELAEVPTTFFAYKGMAYQTPDGVAWNDSGLNEDELNECINNL